MAGSPELPDLRVTVDRRNRRRLSWPGRKGYPIMLRKGESAQDGYLRTIASEAAKAAGEQPPPADPGPAKGTGGLRGRGKRKDPPPAADPPPTTPPPAGEERARPPGSDPKPRGGRPFAKPRATTAELEAVLAELLVLPAIPMGLPVRDPTRDRVIDLPGGGQSYEYGFRPRCEFCRDHFITTGPQAAHELAVMSEQSEPLRRLFERVHGAWSMISVGSVVAGYMAKPMLHHVAPAQVLDSIGPVLGVPPRPEPAFTHDHEHETEDAASPPDPAAGAGPTFGSPVPGSSPAGV